MVWPERPKAEKGELAGRDAANKCQNYLKADLENESWSRIGAAERPGSPAAAAPHRPFGGRKGKRAAADRCNR